MTCRATAFPALHILAAASSLGLATLHRGRSWRRSPPGIGHPSPRRALACEATVGVPSTRPAPSLKCRFAIIGSGPSNALPNLRHVLQPEAGCSVCRDAAKNPLSKNRRGNPCMLVTVTATDGGREHVLVDCGKTFQDGAERHFPALDVKGVDAVIFTHGHADAILGLDSLREVQLAREPPSKWSLSSSTPVYASADTIEEVRRHFFYMLPEHNAQGRVVGGLDVHVVDEGVAFQPVQGLQVRPLPVLHGGCYVCLGFAFGARGEFVYLSDVSEVPPATMRALRECDTEVLVVDALLKSRPGYSHFGLQQALALVRELRPKRAFLIGMACEFDHETDDRAIRRELAAEGLDVRLSYDGLCIDVAVAAPAGSACKS